VVKLNSWADSCAGIGLSGIVRRNFDAPLVLIKENWVAIGKTISWEKNFAEENCT